MTDHSSLQKEKNNTDIVERLTHFCTDWDGSAMNDHSNPMDGLHCLDLREAAAEITRLREDNKKLSDKAEALRKDAERWRLFTRLQALALMARRTGMPSCDSQCLAMTIRPSLRLLTDGRMSMPRQQSTQRRGRHDRHETGARRAAKA